MKDKKSKKQKKDRNEVANPLTARGRFEIKKEIRRLKGKKASKDLRSVLENQVFENVKDIPSPYWNWMEKHGFQETENGEEDYSEDSNAY